MTNDTLLSDVQRASIGAMLGAGGAMALSAGLFTPRYGILFWALVLLCAAVAASLSAKVFRGPIGQVFDTRVLLGQSSKPVAALTLPKPQDLGGISRGTLERVLIPLLLGELSKASDGCGLPDVSRAAARVLDAGQDLLERLAAEPHLHVAARETFAHRIPAAIEAVLALGKHPNAAKKQSEVINALLQVAAAAERDRETLTEGEDAQLQNAMSRLNASIGAERVPAGRRA